MLEDGTDALRPRNADEQAAENRRRRTFRKFSYRGVEVRPPPLQQHRF